MGPNFVFMGDNAPRHWAKAVANWMSAKHFNRLGMWHPQSPPDLKPIEQVWDILGDKVQEKKSRIEGKEKERG